MPLKLTPSAVSPVNNNQTAKRSIPRFLSSFKVLPLLNRASRVPVLQENTGDAALPRILGDHEEPLPEWPFG